MQNTRSRTSASRKMNFEGSEAVKTLKFNNFIVKTMVLEPPDQGPGDDFSSGLDQISRSKLMLQQRNIKTKRLAAPHQCKNIKVIVVFKQ